jgi:hypothetical protein
VKPDLSIKVLGAEENNYSRVCKNCGVAPPKFVNADNATVPNRMCLVTGPLLATNYHGLCCERCVSLATKLAKTYG